jgi:hypothetical protein
LADRGAVGDAFPEAKMKKQLRDEQQAALGRWQTRSGCSGPALQLTRPDAAVRREIHL